MFNGVSKQPRGTDHCHLSLTEENPVAAYLLSGHHTGMMMRVPVCFSPLAHLSPQATHHRSGSRLSGILKSPWCSKLSPLKHIQCHLMGTKDPMWFKQKISPKLDRDRPFLVFGQAHKTRKTTGAFFSGFAFRSSSFVNISPEYELNEGEVHTVVPYRISTGVREPISHFMTCLFYNYLPASCKFIRGCNMKSHKDIASDCNKPF